MSRLRVFDETDPAAPRFVSEDRAAMAAELREIGVRFEQWAASQPLAPGATPELVMAAYRADIDRLIAENGFKTVDVVSIAPDSPQREAMRQKFLDEHFHKEDEVRFFVAGSGLFSLHVNGKVYEIRCEQGDSDRRAGRHPALVRHGPGAELHRHPLLHRAGRLGRPLHRDRHRQALPPL